MEKYERYYEMLELSPGSSASEVRRAYSHLKELYSGDSIATIPLEHEISEEERAKILRRLEEAYEKLTEMFKGPYSDGKRTSEILEDIRQVIAGTTVTGEALKKIRERLRVDLHDIELQTNIRAQHLKNIELERFDALPEAVFVRGYLRAYSKYLMLDAEKVAREYMLRYEAWKKGRNKPA